MDQKLLHSVQPYNARQRRSRTWQRIVSLLACVTVLVTAGALVLPATTQEQRAYCGIEAHTHTDSCYTKVTEHNARYLDCELSTEEPHVHTESCYRLEGAHTHSDDCYTYRRGELKCTETGFHTHTGACFQRIATLTCQLEESEGTLVTVCTEQEGSVHVHADSCWKPVSDDMLTCRLDDPNHIHGPLCYGVWAQTCSRNVHQHSLSCYSNPNADVENPDYWQRLADRVPRTGIWAEDLLAMAQSQLGYRESTRNYQVLSDGQTVRGYTRYGHWMNDPYGEWCAMYVSYCLSYAGVWGMPRHYSCSAWIEELKILDLYREADGFLPDPGDLVFFERGSDNSADHVGIVVRIIPADGQNPLRIQTVEGNSNSRVQYMTYEADDPLICGFGELPRNPSQSYPCGMDEHTHGRTCAEGCSLAEHQHSEACYDTVNHICAMNRHTHSAGCYAADGTLACQMTEHIHTVECVARTVAYISDDMRVYVTIRNVEDLPLELDLNVWAVNQQNDRASFDSMHSAVSQQIKDSFQYISNSSIFQMELTTGGNVYQLPETADVTVQVKFTSPLFSQEQIDQATGLHAFLLEPEQASPEEIPEETVTPDPEGSGQPEQGPISVPTGQISGPGGVHRNEAEGENPSYSAQEPWDADLENTGDGLTGLSYHSNGLTAFALALADNVQTGTFWTRVDKNEAFTDEDAVYMIVSAEGNYALGGTQPSGTGSGLAVPVTLEAVKGNTDYYVIEGSDDARLYWTITPNGSNYTIRNQSSGKYIRLHHVTTGFIFQNTTYYLFNDSATSVRMEYETTENCWRITNGTNYLRKVGDTGHFTGTAEDDGDYRYAYGYPTTTMNYSRNMMIFKLSDVTSLTIPQDPQQSGINNGGAEAPEKPDYPEHIEPSGGKTGDTAVTDPGDASVLIAGKYYSDPATSALENRFAANSFAEHQANDGKVLTDKTVIYGDDDYDAFPSYEPNTFGITLSALGQEYPLPEKDIVQTPVDIVFVLDVSGSMSTTVSGSDANRAVNMTAAVNKAIAHIMEQHPANRVGMVMYSSGAWEVLPLDRYTADNNAYFQYVIENQLFQPTNFNRENVYKIVGTSSLKNDEGVSFAGAGRNAFQGLGTYTQAGIAEAYELFARMTEEETKYTVTLGQGVTERTYTVNRQPVYILVSDGEPTHGTPIYNDVLAGPTYGDGNGDGATSAKGILGYYTILSANYYKSMAGIHYRNPAMFFTIGMSIAKTGTTPLITGSQTGDHYKRAVLDPSAANVQGLTQNGTNQANTATQLRNLLLGSYNSGHQISLTSAWPDDWYGVPQKYIPVLSDNPYAGDYSYADSSYFGEMTESDLDQIFGEIIKNSATHTSYGFILYKRSSVDIRDKLGVGMEVKGTPVLRYGGVNYTDPVVETTGNVTRYTYHGTYVDPYMPNFQPVDLSQLVVTITENPDGTQTVELYIPDNTLPTLSPELIGTQFYYEALPVRLIFQVGLTEEAQQQVLDLRETGGSLTFYTNYFEIDDQNDFKYSSVSTLFPSENNPFYFDQDLSDGNTPPYGPHVMGKTDNVTGTSQYVVECHWDEAAFAQEQVEQVLHEMGNNGKLVFEAETVEIPVEKSWEIVDPAQQAPLELTLYKVVETTSGDGVLTRTAKAVQTLTLTAEDGWKGSFSAPEPGESWYYAIGETVPEYFTAFYGDRITALVDGQPVEMSRVTFGETGAVTTTIQNVPDKYVLPETGGMGTQSYIAGGAALILLTAVLLLYKTVRCRKEDYPSS